MAGDVVVLLDYIGWKEERGIHVVGISLGMVYPEMSGFCVHRLRARRYDCARFAHSNVCYWDSLFRIVGKFLELSTLIPHRIASLSLVVTTAGGRPWNNFPPVGFTRMRWCTRHSKNLAQRHDYHSKVLGLPRPSSYLMNLTAM